MVYFTGDMHGDINRFRQPGMRVLKKGDTLVVCGDFGFIWDGSRAEKKTLKKLGKKRYNLCFIDGAHENFELLNQYPVVEWNGGQAHQISGNLYHLMRGQVFSIEGKTLFTMGGGIGPDDELRTGEGDDARMRWALPSREELHQAAAALERVQGRVDYIATHEPPMKIKAFMQLKSQAQSTEPSGLNTYFEELSKCCEFRHWFFGSMHVDKIIASSHVSLFRKVVKGEF